MAEQTAAEKKAAAEAAAAEKAAEKAAAAEEASRLPVERLLAESEQRFGQPRHVLVGGIAKANLTSRVNLSPDEAQAAIDAFLAGEVETDNSEGE